MTLKAWNEEKDAVGLPRLDLTCPLCRTEWPKNGNLVERYEKRMEMGDPNATSTIADWYREGMNGFPQDAAKSFELNNRAVGMGCAHAPYEIGAAYWYGGGEVARDEAKAIEYMELGAARGCMFTRYYLGNIECDRGNTGVAIKHWCVAAAAGYDVALSELRKLSRRKLSKKDLAESVEAHLKATEEMMSENRKQFAAFEAKHGGNPREFRKYYRPGIVPSPALLFE
jgi:TPR repeat protein